MAGRSAILFRYSHGLRVGVSLTLDLFVLFSILIMLAINDLFLARNFRQYDVLLVLVLERFMRILSTLLLLNVLDTLH